MALELDPWERAYGRRPVQPSKGPQAPPGMIEYSRVNPRAGALSYIDPIKRLQEIEQSYIQHPGRAIGGSGTTGIRLGADIAGWQHMLEEQREYQNLQKLLGLRNAL